MRYVVSMSMNVFVMCFFCLRVFLLVFLKFMLEWRCDDIWNCVWSLWYMEMYEKKNIIMVVKIVILVKIKVYLMNFILKYSIDGREMDII